MRSQEAAAFLRLQEVVIAANGSEVPVLALCNYAWWPPSGNPASTQPPSTQLSLVLHPPSGKPPSLHLHRKAWLVPHRQLPADKSPPSLLPPVRERTSPGLPSMDVREPPRMPETPCVWKKLYVKPQTREIPYWEHIDTGFCRAQLHSEMYLEEF